MAQFDLLGGVNAAQPMDLNTSTGYVLSNLNTWLNSAMSNVNKKYFGAGFGGAIHAPSVYNATAKPYIETGANQARTALTDLYQKDRDFKESQRRFDVLRKDKSYAESEASNNQRRATNEANTWYNWL